MDSQDIIRLPDTRHAIFSSLFLLANRLEIVGNQVLEGLTTKQWFLLTVLNQHFAEPPTISELAGKMGMSHQNVKQLAIRLEARGFLRIEPDGKDRRALRLCPTQELQEYEQAHLGRDDAFLGDIFSGFAGRELVALRDYLVRLYDTVLETDYE